MTDRIRVTGGPWPERIGLEGVIVPKLRDEYPWDDRNTKEVIIFIPDDPLCDSDGRDWTCSIGVNDIEATGVDDG